MPPCEGWRPLDDRVRIVAGQLLGDQERIWDAHAGRRVRATPAPGPGRDERRGADVAGLQAAQAPLARAGRPGAGWTRSLTSTTRRARTGRPHLRGRPQPHHRLRPRHHPPGRRRSPPGTRPRRGSSAASRAARRPRAARSTRRRRPQRGRLPGRRHRPAGHQLRLLRLLLGRPARHAGHEDAGPARSATRRTVTPSPGTRPSSAGCCWDPGHPGHLRRLRAQPRRASSSASSASWLIVLLFTMAQSPTQAGAPRPPRADHPRASRTPPDRLSRRAPLSTARPHRDGSWTDRRGPSPKSWTTALTLAGRRRIVCLARRGQTWTRIAEIASARTEEREGRSGRFAVSGTVRPVAGTAARRAASA